MTKQLIPVNSLSRHVAPIAEEMAKRAAEVIASGYFVLGPNVTEFEREFADYCGAKHFIGLGNGTDALELALKGVGVESGDSVVICANAAMYSATAVLACGAEPIFIDIKDDATMDPGAFEAAIHNAKSPIKAVILTHLYGQLGDVERFSEIAKANGIALIEDCAQAHGAESKDGRRAGSFGDVATFSFYPTKNLGAIGDGGGVTCQSDEIAARIRSLRQYGWSAKYTNSLSGGRNTRLDEVQAAMLRGMLPLLDKWNDRRREIANRYAREITNPKLKVRPEVGKDNVGHLYVLRVDDREAFKSHMAKEGVQVEVHYPTPDYQQPLFGDRFKDIKLERTEQDCATVVTLPCFPELDDEEVTQVIAACQAY